MPFILAGIAEWVEVTLLPLLLRLVSQLGFKRWLAPFSAWLARWIQPVLRTTFSQIKGLALVGFGWFIQFLSQEVVRSMVSAGLVFAGLVGWAAFLAVFWTFATGSTLQEIFNANPLSGAPAGVMYLASHAFPLKFFFGLSIAYIQFRFTLIAAAITLQRLIKIIPGF